MLEGLDKVDWSVYEKLDGVHAIPELLTQISSGQFEPISMLFPDYFIPGFNLPPWMPQIVPFILQILKQDQSQLQTRIGSIGVVLIYPLRETVIACRAGLKRVAKELHYYPMAYAARCVHTYEAVIEGFDVFVDWLSREDFELRMKIISVLVELPEKGREIATAFNERIKIETDKNVKAALIEGMGKIISTSPSFVEFSERRIYLDFLVTLAKRGGQDLATLAAAISALKVASEGLFDDEYMDVDSEVFEVLKRFLFEISWSGFYDENRLHRYGKREILKLIQKNSQKTLVEFLNLPFITRLDAHIIVQILLEYSINRVDHLGPYNHYLPYRPGLNLLTTFDYLSPDNKTRYPSEPEIIYIERHRHEHIVENRDLIDAITKCEKFWELPTNLLSFFFGLPDSRDELRALIEKS